MAFSFSNESLENLKNQINIVDVVGRAVQLKRAGSNYKGICPFHNEKTPSFVVSEQKQIFTCFGCGASGDAIEFVKRYYNLDFAEAVEKLASEYGIQLEKYERSDNREKYYQVNKLAAGYFYRAFTEHANKGYPYMKRRGITPAILKKFGIGYADEQWDSLYRYLLSKGIDTKIMTELGLVSERNGRYFDKFRNRVMFPIINTRGKVIGFGGRAISSDDNPKYLNSPESPVFKKKNNLYGLNITRQSVGREGCIILVEGYMDVISLYQSGIENIAASLGTALTENQARLITRYTKDVILSYDSDNAGINAALRGLDILKPQGCKVKVLHVSDGKDPDEYVKKNGKKAFLGLVDKALPYGEYKLENAKRGFNLETDEGKIDYLKKATAILKDMSPVEQEIYIKRLSQDLHIAGSAIRMELMNEQTVKTDVRTERVHDDGDAEEVRLSPLEKNLLKIILTEGEYAEKIRDYPGILESPFANKLYNLITAECDDNQDADLNRIRDNLSYEENKELNEIIDGVFTAGNEEQIFNDCIRSWKESGLEKEEERLLTLLSMADEEDNQDKIAELTNKLMEVQKKKNSNRGV